MKVLWDFLSPDGAPIKRALKAPQLDQLMTDLGTDSPEGILGALHRDPQGVLKRISSMFNANIAIKIHSYHIGANQSVASEFIALPSTEVMILRRRNTLKQYVSLLKALAANSWDGTDTTDIKVRVDPVSYGEFLSAMQAWYDGIRAQCSRAGKDLLEIGYEEHLENVNRDQMVLASLIEPWFDRNGIKVSRSGYVPKKVQRQDSSLLEESITNWDEIRHMLSRS